MWAEASFVLEVVEGKEKLFELLKKDCTDLTFKSSNNYFKGTRLAFWDARTNKLNIELVRFFTDDNYFFGGLIPVYSSESSEVFELVEENSKEKTGVFCQIERLKGKTSYYETNIDFEWHAAKDGRNHLFSRTVRQK